MDSRFMMAIGRVERVLWGDKKERLEWRKRVVFERLRRVFGG
jgi:hypothetical protein